MREFLDIEVVKIILDDAEWVHPYVTDWEEVSPQLFRFVYRNSKAERLTVFFNSYELSDLLRDGGELSNESAELISDMVVYQMVGDFWIPSSPLNSDDTADKVFSETIEGKVITQFFTNVPTGIVEWGTV